MGREDQPADMQWARAFAAAMLGLVLACAALGNDSRAPNLRNVPAEFRAAGGIPCLVIGVFTGDF
jgi:hypothetical protein